MSNRARCGRRQTPNPLDPDYQIIELPGKVCTIQSIAEQETFHPVIGPLAEAEALYIRQLDLRERIAGSREPFVVWDIGLGGGGNALALFRATRHLTSFLQVYSFDRTIAPLKFALGHARALKYPEGYERELQTLSAQGKVVFLNGCQELSWQVELGDFSALIHRPEAEAWPRPDAIFFDPYSPAKNPAMWTLPLFSRLRELTGGKLATLATYSRSTMLRAALLLAGFYVGVGEATGEKEETTIAATVPGFLRRPLASSWLRKARSSRSAEPLAGSSYRQSPLSEASWAALQQHRQFEDCHRG